MASRLIFAGMIAASLLLSGAIARAEQPVDFLRDVRPLLTKKCHACHSQIRQKSGLRLDAAVLMRKGGDSGPIVVPGNSAESLLIDKVTGRDDETIMPPEGEGEPLTEAEIALLTAWIDQGAVGPADERIAEDQASFWSFQPPQRPAVPQVGHATWERNPIDAYIASAHEERGLKPNPPADKSVLLRRVYLDLIGLPPTRDQLHAFLADDSLYAYEQVVESLLNSPQYGERWGRHWMDVWRYSDWHGSGNEIRYGMRYLWRWRDWIVKSLNQDKGYDRMIVEMLAADEVAPTDWESLPATGYIGRNWYKFNRNVWMRELVEHTAVGFLGLTLRCARCHDHKYDPVSQEEYYRFRAFFEPHDLRTDRISMGVGTTKDTKQGAVPADGIPRVYDKTLDATTYVFHRGDDRYPDQDRPVTPGIPAALGGTDLQIETVSLPAIASFPDLHPALLKERIELAEARLARAESEAAKTDEAFTSAKRMADLNVTLARETLASERLYIAAAKARIAGLQTDYERLGRQHVARRRKATLAQAHLDFAKTQHDVDTREQTATAADGGDSKELTEAQEKLTVAKAALKMAEEKLAQEIGAEELAIGTAYPRTSTGRRSALAGWITDPNNPRTARVAINHIWLRHFGRALVDSVADFGMRAHPPSHPELLDWLAVELIEHGWSMKHLHRLMVTSNTYRMSSAFAADDANLSTDARNRYLWRMNSRRLEAEGVRDSVLHLASRLDCALGGKQIPASEGQTARRRSLYFQSAPNRRMPFLELFDGANPDECYERKPSVIPQQSLALLNSAVATSSARLLTGEIAEQLERIGRKDDEPFIVAAFEQVLCREPTSQERARCGQFLGQQTDLLRNTTGRTTFAGASAAGVHPAQDPVQRARENLVLVLFNHNDFVTIR
jgi:hypothetical protein